MSARCDLALVVWLCYKAKDRSNYSVRLRRAAIGIESPKAVFDRELVE
jgi:hypothetical protein